MPRKTPPKIVIKPVLSETVGWFQKAVPDPSPKNVSTQMGVHFEEVREMIQSLGPTTPRAADLMLAAETALHDLANHMKQNEGAIVVRDRKLHLDAICDQIVTASGCAHMSDMDVVSGLNEVNRSNFSKFDAKGQPIFDANRKVIKGPLYKVADLSPFV